MINTLIKWILRIFALAHMIEVGVAIAEQAHITAGICFIFGIFDLIASHYVKECDCD